jgi:hypothetical protein
MVFGNHEKEQVGHLTRLDLMGLQLKLLRLAGVLAPENVIRSAWKYKIFILVSTLYFLIYIPQLCSMLIAIYKYWGNIDMITKILFQIMFAADSVILTSYFIARGRQLALLFDMLETNFLVYMDNVVTPENKLEILKEASRKSVIMTRILVSIFLSVILGWIFSPLVLKHIDKSEGNYKENNSEELWKYYCYILWLPKELSEPSMYIIIYICQVLTVYISVSQYTSCNLIFFSLMFHISTHFKLLVSSFENIGKAILTERNKMEDHVSSIRWPPLFVENTFNTDLIPSSCKVLSNSDGTFASVEGENPCLSKLSQYAENILSPVTGEMSGNQAAEHENMDNLTGTAFYEQQINEYFINCIRYHQAILE